MSTVRVPWLTHIAVQAVVSDSLADKEPPPYLISFWVRGVNRGPVSRWHARSLAEVPDTIAQGTESLRATLCRDWAEFADEVTDG